MLFDGIERSDTAPAPFSEPEFSYLNRSARPELQRVRDLLESWFTRYPLHEQEELRRRFRSAINQSHRAAFFELFLHELVLRLGCQVTIHPTVDAGPNRPDFLVHSPAGQSFYLEAVVVTGQSEEEMAAERRSNEVYDALNRIESPDFFIGVEVKGAPQSPVPARKIRRFIETKLQGLDPEKVVAADDDGIRWPFDYDGWHIEFFPIPKGPKTRGRMGIRPLGVWIKDLHAEGTAGSIKRDLLKKARKYGELGLPYIIATNILAETVDETDIMEALFGTEVVLPFEGPTGREARISRRPDGLWTEASGPRYRRVSAVLASTGLRPTNISSVAPTLYHNPWAAHPYTLELHRLSQAIPRNGNMIPVPGADLATVLGLPEIWPAD